MGRKTDPTLGLPWLLTTFPLKPLKVVAAEVRQVKEAALKTNATPFPKVEEAIQAR